MHMAIERIVQFMKDCASRTVLQKRQTGSPYRDSSDLAIVCPLCGELTPAIENGVARVVPCSRVPKNGFIVVQEGRFVGAFRFGSAAETPDPQTVEDPKESNSV